MVGWWLTFVIGCFSFYKKSFPPLSYIRLVKFQVYVSGVSLLSACSTIAFSDNDLRICHLNLRIFFFLWRTGETGYTGSSFQVKGCILSFDAGQSVDSIQCKWFILKQIFRTRLIDSPSAKNSTLPDFVGRPVKPTPQYGFTHGQDSTRRPTATVRILLNDGLVLPPDPVVSWPGHHPRIL